MTVVALEWKNLQLPRENDQQFAPYLHGVTFADVIVKLEIES